MASLLFYYYMKYVLIFNLLISQILPEYTVLSSPLMAGNEFELCKNGEILTGYVLKGGRKAGAYYKIGETSTIGECIELCCQSEPSECHLAIFVRNSCYSVECAKAELCKPIKTSKTTKIQPSIFRRHGATYVQKKDPSLILPDVPESNITLKREKRHGFCQHYTGITCQKYLDKDKLIYYEEDPEIVEHRLSGPLTVIQSHFKTSCKHYALPALCLTSFPYCESKIEPQPIQLCQDDCKDLYEKDKLCRHDFSLAKKVAKKYPPLLKIMPNCSNLVSSSGKEKTCVKLGLDNDAKGISTIQSSYEKRQHIPFTTADSEDGESETIGETQPPTTASSHSKFASSDPSEKLNSKVTSKPSQRTPKNELKTSKKPWVKTPTMTSDSVSKLSKNRQNQSHKTFETKDQVSSKNKMVANNVKSSTIKEENVVKKNPATNASFDHVVSSEQPSLVHIGGNHDLPSTIDGASSNSKVDTTNQDVTTRIKDIPKTTIAPNKTTISSVLLSSVLSTSHGSNHSVMTSLDDGDEKPTVVKVNETKDGIDLETVDKEKVSTVSLQVSTVGDTEITLPKNTASLYASAWPKESEAHPYTYKWIQLASPKDGNGYMEGKNAQRVVLSKLTIPGVYQFQVIVKNGKHAYGTAFVNVTVKEREHVNKPPRADISPKEQSITLPTNEVVLDGSKSSDDVKIVKYKWQEIKGPLTEKEKTTKSGLESPILQLKSLIPGVYTYKLTVTDSEGETDSTLATITVNAEKDYPPVARAENNVLITLPVNYVTLYGNGSTDDHGIKSYEWMKDPLSPTCDLQGTTESILHVSNMVVGDYTFTLKVTDTGDQSSESKVTVFVQPEKNTAPVAKAGDDKDLVYPDDSTTLNGKDSHDDQGISRYHWEQVSGPSSVKMSGVDNMVLSLSHLTEGRYLFKLTVYDSKGLTGTDTVSVNVKKDGNQLPVANAGPDVLVKLPNRAAALDGSKSSDDYGIVKYSWSRDMKSPAAGDIINNSDHQAILRLSNLVKGIYKFRLTVTDGKGLHTTDDAKIVVKEDTNSPNLVELYLEVDVTSFTEENKRQLVRKLAVSLNVMDGDIIVEHIQPSGRGNNLVVLFYVRDSLTNQIRDGKEIADLLKQNLRENFFEFKMEEVNPYVCRNNCSGHGSCDQHTKQCICESFWMQDPFKANFGLRERNCDWSILYVVVIIFGVIVAIVGITWGICFCLGRTKGRRRRNQYSIVGEEDSDNDIKNTTMELYPRSKFANSSIMSETDMDTDEETLFENEKPYKGSRTKLNGFINGHKTPHT